MSQKFFLQRGETKTGPFTSDQIQGFAKDGKLQPTDVVYDENGRHLFVSEVPSLENENTTKTAQLTPEEAEYQFQLATKYYGGRGVGQDYTLAAKGYRLAADQGHAYAQYMLGYMYSTGRGVPQHNKEAYIWLSVAVAGGEKSAEESLENTRRLLSPEQLAEAQEEATARFKQIEERQQ